MPDALGSVGVEEAGRWLDGSKDRAAQPCWSQWFCVLSPNGEKPSGWPTQDRLRCHPQPSEAPGPDWENRSLEMGGHLLILTMETEPTVWVQHLIYPLPGFRAEPGPEALGRVCLWKLGVFSLDSLERFPGWELWARIRIFLGLNHGGISPPFVGC